MLIVVSIMMILMAAGASVMRPAGDSRRIREAARAVNIYLSSARNRAMETGRPCGVMLRRFQGAASAVMYLDQCEVPPCYCGETEQSTVRVIDDNGGNFIVNFGSEWYPDNMIRPHDLIQFNCQGPMYLIGNGSNGTDATGYIKSAPRLEPVTLVDATQVQAVPWPPTPTPSLPVSYRIYRSPLKNAATPLQLPASTVIDLDASGIDNTNVVFGDGVWTDTIMILFSPNGAVERVFSPGSSVPTSYPTNPIFLLIGKRERIPYNLAGYDPNNPDTFANFQDLNNLWVVINSQTGLVTTGEMGVTTSTTFDASARIQTRALARDLQGMGGK